MLTKFLTTSSFLLIMQCSFSQQISNIQTKQQDKTIIIIYDLSGLISGSTATVSLYCSDDGGATWGNALQKVVGDVGANVKAGINKNIIWDVLAERDQFVGDAIAFEIRATINTFGLSIEPDLVFIKGGFFFMGSHDGEDNEKPVHKVMVSDFYMGKYEVTQKQWIKIMNSNPSNIKGDYLPVENASWDEVQEYISKLNLQTGKSYRLPTEAEWEYACRAGTATPFNTGDCLNIREANYNGTYPYENCTIEDNFQNVLPISSFSPNAWGLFDMHGNVWEWCSDWYDADYYSKSPLVDPQGPTSGTHRVNRGGSWTCKAGYCRSAHRNYSFKDIRSLNIGFRLVSSQ